MSAHSQIEKLVQKKLLGRKIDGAGFIDELLDIACEVGEIQCAPASDQALRFQIPSEPPAFDVGVDAARGKLRMMCARLGILCQESGDPDVSLYGGEGIIKKQLCVEPADGAIVGPGMSLGRRDTASNPRATLCLWKTRFKNTPSEQEFIIVPSINEVA